MIHKSFTDNNAIIKKDCTNIKILPMAFPPPIKMYLNYSFQLSVILAYSHTFDWFYSNFIQVFSSLENNDYLTFHFLPTDRDAVENQFYLNSSFLNEDILNIKDRIVEMMINWLSDDYYAGICLVESEIPGTDLYMSDFPYPHTQFIFGYDLTKQVFKTINFNENNNYTVIDISFDDLYKAYNSDYKKNVFSQDQFKLWKIVQYPIMLFKFDHNAKFKFEIEDLYFKFVDYVKGSPVDLKYKVWKAYDDRDYLFDNETKWGINSSSNFPLFAENILKNEQLLNINQLHETDKDILIHLNIKKIIPFHGLREHKTIMMNRLKYLEDGKYLDVSRKISLKYADAESEAEILRLKFLKAIYKLNNLIINNTNVNQIKEMNIFKFINSHINKIKLIEEDVLSLVINELSKNN